VEADEACRSRHQNTRHAVPVSVVTREPVRAEEPTSIGAHERTPRNE
jgi:hypothetical protein